MALIKKNIGILGVMLCTAVVSCNNEGVTPLIKAAINDDHKKLVELVSTSANVNETTKYGWTALVFSSEKGYENIVKTLLEEGADLNITTKMIPSSFETTGSYPPTTALAESLKYNHVNISKLLIENGAKIDKKSIALLGGINDLSFIKFMLDNKKIDINTYSGIEYYPSALCVAISRENDKILKYLLSVGAKINKLYGTCFPLSKAVRLNRLDSVHTLLEYGAMLYMGKNNAVCEAIYTPNKDRDLRINLKIIKLLIQTGKNWETEECSVLTVSKLIKKWNESSVKRGNQRYVNYYAELKKILGLCHIKWIIYTLCFKSATSHK